MKRLVRALRRLRCAVLGHRLVWVGAEPAIVMDCYIGEFVSEACDRCCQFGYVSFDPTDEWLERES